MKFNVYDGVLQLNLVKQSELLRHIGHTDDGK